MKPHIELAAKEETREAAAWYERQRAGLGLEFLIAVEATILEIGRSPERFPRLETLPEEKSVRRALVDRFSYVVIFEEIEGKIRILAVAHTSRRPSYWKRRR
ncbi:MAG: type II toxin-antitoxin system RelE/ParE family toxin [Planctomycetes bacterium]|nr:type II toxin-antitoxin system RelE/ParE family toxin [Planctomycetota bacterium]